MDLPLSSLNGNCLFRSAERADSHRQVATELADHKLSWGRGVVDAALFKGTLSTLQVYLLRYGAEVSVSPEPFDNFALVHMSVRGGAEIETDGIRLAVAEGRSAFIAPRKSIKLRWIPGTDQLILKVPGALLERARAALPGAPLELPSGYLLPRTLTPQWGLQMQSLLGAMAQNPDGALNPAWIDHFENGIAMFLLGHQTAAQALLSNHALGPKATERYVCENLSNPEAERRMNAVLDLMQSRLAAPIALFDLARAAGVSERTLNALCHRFHGMSPMELLRTMRLDAVRSKLMLAPHTSITQAALEFGFGHPGRFAAYYEQRFNELPHETLNQHKH